MRETLVQGSHHSYSNLFGGGLGDLDRDQVTRQHVPPVVRPGLEHQRHQRLYARLALAVQPIGYRLMGNRKIGDAGRQGLGKISQRHRFAVAALFIQALFDNLRDRHLAHHCPYFTVVVLVRCTNTTIVF